MMAGRRARRTALVSIANAVYIAPTDFAREESMMGETAANRGHMEIGDQRATFNGFLVGGLWTSVLIIQTVALLTLAFAIGVGWWAGLAAYVIIGAGAGLFFKMQGAWWAILVVAIVLLGLGGLIVPPIASMVA